MRTPPRPLSNALVALALIGVACAPATPAAPTADTAATQPRLADNQRLSVALQAAVSTMDAHAAIGTNARRFGVFETLVAQKDDGSIEAGLATEWRLVNDTTWQFTLAQGRVFHDNTPVTVQDVKFSFDRVLNPANRLGVIARVPTVAEVTVVDPRTVNIVTRAPDPILLRRVATIAIIPQAYTERVGATEFGLKPIGSGPYRVREFIANDRFVLEAMPNHPSRPTLTEISFRTVTEASARIAGLRTGEVDVIQQIPTDQAETLRGQGFQIVANDAGVANVLSFNMFATDSPIADRRVRQALNYAVDKESIARNIYRGFTKVLEGQMLQPQVVGFNPNLRAYPFDPAQARRLLAEAGYPNGFNLGRMDVFLNAPEWPSIAQFVQQQFRDIGVQVEINVYSDVPTFLDRFYGRQARAPLFSGSFQTTPAMDAAFGFDWYLGTRPMPERFYNNPEFDRVYLPSQTEMNEQRRVQLLQQAAAIMREDAPVVFLVGGAWIWAANSKIQGLSARTDLDPRFEQMRRVQ